MRKLFLSVSLCLMIFMVIGPLNETAKGKSTPPTEPGGLFLVEIDGERVVLQYFGSEQTWQYFGPQTPGWYEGIKPHPFEHKLWYPHLQDTYNKTMDEHLDWIDDLDYAGIDKWRIATFWDTVPLKASIFGGYSTLERNTAVGYNTEVYFPVAKNVAGTRGATWARTGNEPCLNDPLCDGAIVQIGPHPTLGFSWENYPEEGLQVWHGEGTLGQDLIDDTSWQSAYTSEELAMFPSIIPSEYYFTVYYALPRTHAQDHWAWRPTRSMYDIDLNSISDYLPYAIQGGHQDMGVWTVTDKWPELDREKKHTIKISAVINPPYVTEDRPAGAKVPVKNLTVIIPKKEPDPTFDEGVWSTVFLGNSYSKNTPIHMKFEYEGVVHNFKVMIK